MAGAVGKIFNNKKSFLLVLNLIDYCPYESVDNGTVLMPRLMISRNTPTHRCTCRSWRLSSFHHFWRAAVEIIRMAHKNRWLNVTIKEKKEEKRCFDCKNLSCDFSSSFSDFYFHFIHRKAIVKWILEFMWMVCVSVLLCGSCCIRYLTRSCGLVRGISSFVVVLSQPTKGNSTFTYAVWYAWRRLESIRKIPNTRISKRISTLEQFKWLLNF